MTHRMLRTRRARLIGLSPCLVLFSILCTPSANALERGDPARPSLSAAAIKALGSPPAELQITLRRELEESWRAVVEPALKDALADPEADVI